MRSSTVLSKINRSYSNSTISLDSLLSKTFNNIVLFLRVDFVEVVPRIFHFPTCWIRGLPQFPALFDIVEKNNPKSSSF
jgi:hypothetical protein